MSALTPAKMLKMGLLAVALFICSLILSQLILDFVNKGDVITVDIYQAVTAIALMLAIAVVQALTIGGWDTNSQYIIVPLALTAGILMSMLGFDPLIIGGVCVGSFLFVLYAMYDASNTLKSMLRYSPNLIFRYSTKTIFFVFSIVAGILMYLNYPTSDSINIGKQIAQAVGEPVQKVVDEQLASMAGNNISNLESGFSGMDTESLNQALRELGLPGLNPGTSLVKSAGVDIKDLIEKQVNTFIEPYKTFVRPILGLLTFLFFEFLASLAYILFSLVIRPIFFFAKKVKFFKVETVMLEQEQLRF